MSRLTSVTSSARIEELRDGQAFPVSFFTGVGRNGTRQYRLTKQDRVPIDISGMVLKLVVKTGPDALATELDAGMPLTATIDNAGLGLFSFDFSAVDFVDPQTRVLAILYDDAGAAPVVLSQSTTVIRKAGI